MSQHLGERLGALARDSDITLLLMMARGLRRNPSGAFCPAEIRLLRYGFVPDAFNSHVMLRKLGLPEVQEVAHDNNGTRAEVQEGRRALHRLLLPDALASRSPGFGGALVQELQRARAEHRADRLGALCPAVEVAV